MTNEGSKTLDFCHMKRDGYLLNCMHDSAKQGSFKNLSMALPREIVSTKLVLGVAVSPSVFFSLVLDCSVVNLMQRYVVVFS